MNEPSWDVAPLRSRAIDHDAHVVMYERFHGAATVMLVLRFSEDAKLAMIDAEHNLLRHRKRYAVACEALARLPKKASKEDRRAARDASYEAETAVIRTSIVAAQALDYLRRTTATLEQAVQLHAMGRR
jgi:hypothetical protein